MKKFKWVLCNIPELIAGAAMIIMITVVSINVVLRYAFSRSIVWCEEVAAISFIWLIFVGAAACYKRHELISIDILVSFLPSSIRKAADTILYIFMVIVNLVLCYLSLEFSMSAWTKISLSLRIPYTFFDAATTVGFAFMGYYAIKDLVCFIRGKEFVNPDEIAEESAEKIKNTM